MSHGDYFLTELIIRTKYRTMSMLSLSRNDLVKKNGHFTIFVLLIMPKQNCTDLKKTRKDIEKDSENTDHSSSNM